MIFWTAALAIGVLSVCFAWAADAAYEWFEHLRTGTERSWLLPLLITPIGFLICAGVARRFFPGTEGSGIPQAIAARQLRGGSERGWYLSLRLAAGKFILTVVGLGCGASIGREGPTVQLGASIMLQAAKFGGMAHARGLILAGSAAGIAAAFNAPLAGIVFAIEEMGRSYESRTNGLVLTAVIIAGLSSLGLVGSYTYFGVTDEVGALPAHLPLIAVCGVVGGMLGAGFSASTLWLTRRIRRWRVSRPRSMPYVVAGIAGVAVAVLGIAAGGATFGTGYAEAHGALEGEALPLHFFALKFAATLASTVSGIPGGLFAPSLAVGAGIGSTIGVVLGTNVGLAALLGMAGYFAGVVQAPMTAFIILLEMTGNQTNVIALMASAMIGYGTARVLTPEPLYHALSRLVLADAIRRRREIERSAASAEAAAGKAADRRP